MCGRYAVKSDFKTYGIAPPPGFQGTYNATPGSFLPVILKNSPFHAELMKWGLVPHWSKTPRVKFSTINARAETVGISPVFREAFHKRRCLVPVIGFYEWRKNPDGTKTPYFIRLKSRTWFTFAGIWDSWKDAEGKEFKSYSIITCEPNEVMKPIHNRMPVILPREVEELWATLTTPMKTLLELLKPYDPANMWAYPISTRVNNPMNNDERNVEPLPETASFRM
jgi:putative SOS response-associated peptidase YedK